MAGLICAYKVWYPDRVETYLQQTFLTSTGVRPLAELPPPSGQ
jgi:hypothetical protein